MTGTIDPVTGEKTPGLVDLAKPITNPDGTKTNPIDTLTKPDASGKTAIEAIKDLTSVDPETGESPIDALTGTIDPVTGEKTPGLIQEFQTLKDKLGLDMNNPATVEDRLSTLENESPSNCSYTLTIPEQTYDVTVGCDGVPALTLI